MYATVAPSEVQELRVNRAGEAKSTNHSDVLVVDDDPAMHTLLGLILRPLQLEVRYALDGITALDMVAAHRPSLIILDLMMPGLDGFGMLERLCETAEIADIPVVIFSARAGLDQDKGYNWPPQVVEVVGKSKPRPPELRDLVKRQLTAAT